MAAAALLLVVATPMAALAQGMPSATLQEILIKTTLLTFNDANITGDYAVLRARLSKPFRDQFPVEKLKETFKAFADKEITIDPIAASPPTPPISTTTAS